MSNMTSETTLVNEKRTDSTFYNDGNDSTGIKDKPDSVTMNSGDSYMDVVHPISSSSSNSGLQGISEATEASISASSVKKLSKEDVSNSHASQNQAMSTAASDKHFSNDHPPSCSIPKPLSDSEKPTEKSSSKKKKPDSLAKNSNNNVKNPCPFPSPRLPGMSEPTSASTSTSTSSSIVTKLSDAKISDSHNTVSSCSSTRSDSIDSTSTASIKRHTGGDCCWEAIRLANAQDAPLGLSHFRLLKRLGYGDIGSVYLVELKGTSAYFAMKVMDRASLVSRNKLLRAQTEREILGLLDHPFLPNLYSHFETEKFYCLVMEYCSGGNLHSLRQKQPNKYFTEQAARFYTSEILLALEYLHMLGVIYRDLKPENVLVREGGHIMLSDFDLSLRCSVNPTLVTSSSVHQQNTTCNALLGKEQTVQGCIQPSSFFPRILPKYNRKSKSDFGIGSGALPELMAEPTNARSMSFVGTHEYLAPEIIRGEGHGSAVDWWTFGIFLYELLHGTTPFKGSGNRATLHNVVGQPLKFPDSPVVSSAARDLIRGLLVKDPEKRIAYRRGATEIRQHPFFEGVNWALVRSATPPHVPDPVDFSQFAIKEEKTSESATVFSASAGNGNGSGDGGGSGGGGGSGSGSGSHHVAGGNKGTSTDSSYLDFEYF